MTTYTGRTIDTPEGTAEFNRVVEALCDLDRQIEETEDDLQAQFGYTPAAGETGGYARAYRDRLDQITRLKRNRERLEAYLLTI